MPHGLGELPPGLALTASLCFPSVVSVGSATGHTAFPAEVFEASVGGRLVALFALPLLTSVHVKTGLSNVKAGLEPKWLRMFCELVNKKVPNPLGNYGKCCERPCGLDHVGEPDLLGQSIHKNPITSNSNRVSHKFGQRPMQAGSRDHGELMQRQDLGHAWGKVLQKNFQSEKTYSREISKRRGLRRTHRQRYI